MIPFRFNISGFDCNSSNWGVKHSGNWKLSFTVSNFCSLLSKKDTLTALRECCEGDTIFEKETWLYPDNSNKLSMSHNFSSFRKDRCTSCSGGVIIAVKKHLQARQFVLHKNYLNFNAAVQFCNLYCRRMLCLPDLRGEFMENLNESLSFIYTVAQKHMDDERNRKDTAVTNNWVSYCTRSDISTRQGRLTQGATTIKTTFLFLIRRPTDN